MLNDTQCRTAKPKDKPYKLTDGKGLVLEIKPNGVKAWRYRFKLTRDGVTKENLFAIGEYVSAPAGETADANKARRDGLRFTLAEARLERDKARDLVKQGINPAHNRQLTKTKLEQENAITFEGVAREWLALRDWIELTKTKRLGMLQRVVFPKIGSFPLRSITPAQILDVLITTDKTNGRTVAFEARRTMSGVFEFAISTLRAEADPTYPVRKSIPANKTQHKRPLEPEEIGQMLRDLGGYGGRYETTVAFRLMWLTLCRPSEAAEAQWSEFDLDNATWTILAERMKKRVEHTVPLPRQAVELLRTLHGITGHRAHLFPNRDDYSHPMSTASFRQMLKALNWAGKYSPHATRTTGSTRLNEMGFSTDWIERQLAHTEPNAVRRTYNHAKYMANRAQMMQQWADLLDAWQTKTGAEIIPLRGHVA
ncbi:tyrosine-type recombinase/integrase [Pseudomonas sp. CCI3.2]|uniref:tyrosine-type recombinase/integrase n=1 Tax=unclassified Pseudomonas TaxID=196821 RepID=UPI002AC9C6A8|nr:MULTISPECIES: tyrosine-type recombinase/integrase [unclassified Pseudomonas]MEB0078277.1 tyrosine-type recombinase/integrase [Pseudomonas sp. MH10out]MEB0101731.1 tyrosine-type recombinase/integrase [Pseudomonas sp. CCI3.2]MEB0160083.1 tyrosine-type recombinase/integrase [Pseudomonas sp. AH2 (2023)]MEB0168020.1 tyrosine-type recombinase/integrase [Pseudomonas sp. CCC4.4]WPX28852.1 tyrosine-type recombinase/integrase [Pseudomonas sp. AH2]